MTVAGADPMRAFTLLDEPLWKVLYVFHHLMDREAERALVRRSERVDSGTMTAMAFNAPKLLADEQRTVRDAIDALDGDPEDTAVTVQQGQALLARVLKGRALDPDALVS